MNLFDQFRGKVLAIVAELSARGALPPEPDLSAVAVEPPRGASRPLIRFPPVLRQPAFFALPLPACTGPSWDLDQTWQSRKCAIRHRFRICPAHTVKS